MTFSDLPLDLSEQIQFSLRRLYDSHGYRRYRMNKFEEYDLYARNKDFLISDHVLTFTDSDGKLMALKPDVTLSIVKNSPDAPGVRKLYYNENVYRVTKDASGFREILQLGLECLGQVDECCVCEVVYLAAKSLDAIAPDWILDLSHVGLIRELAQGLGFPKEKEDALFALISARNRHELLALCREAGLSDASAFLLTDTALTRGEPARVIEKLEKTLGAMDALTELKELTQALDAWGVGENLRIDFSVAEDIHYYNGLVFKGFVRDLPKPVLTGGQYDKLMKKMNRASRAIGFAVYTDQLERLEQALPEFDVDTVLVYDPSTPLAQLRAAADSIGGAVLLQPSVPQGIRCRRILKLRSGEVSDL
ncbi:MAG: ATP phosphoribosyltransferase regulatory subunit [Oscillospiraceae bacterium]|nr:ATP phosphoribosyltransferase regulatory subunit [Oscillospiraceae bacterium]